MYAIIESGGKQFRVEEGSKVLVDKLSADVGAKVVIDKVLMLGGGDFKLGAPYLESVQVNAEVISHGRGDKILVFKRWRRNDSRKLKGHRQDYTALRITGISA